MEGDRGCISISPSIRRPDELLQDYMETCVSADYEYTRGRQVPLDFQNLRSQVFSHRQEIVITGYEQYDRGFACESAGRTGSAITESNSAE